VLGPVRGLLRWWMQNGGLTWDVKTGLEAMKAQFGKVSVGIYMVMAALGNTLFNALINVVCGAASVFTDVVSSTEKVTSEAGSFLSHSWDAGFRNSWNYLNRHLAGEHAAASADKITALAEQMGQLRASAGAVPLQKILVEASAGILRFEKFNEYLQPFLIRLMAATGVLTHLGEWIGGLVPSVLNTMGLGAPQLDSDSYSISPLEDADKVTDAIGNSLEALSAESTVPNNAEVDAFEEVSFDHLCLLLSEMERDVRKLKKVLPRDQACPDVGNGLLGQVRPDELQIPIFKNIALDMPPLW